MKEAIYGIRDVKSWRGPGIGFFLLTALIALTQACGVGGRPTGGASSGGGAEDPTNTSQELMPQFTEDGSLLRPEGWEAWVLAGTSIGLTYNEPASIPGPGEPPGTFLNVYLQPWAYQSFMATGSFPEGTMFVLAGSRPVGKADPARGGFYQGEISLLEVHAKVAGVHESGWGFYNFGGDAEVAPLFPADASCYSCHRDEAAFDQVFAQFYPAIREKLVSQGALERVDTDPR